MNIEPEVRKQDRVAREQQVPVTEEHEEIEGMTERPHKTHEIDESPFRIFGLAVGLIIMAGIIFGIFFWIFSSGNGAG